MGGAISHVTMCGAASVHSQARAAAYLHKARTRNNDTLHHFEVDVPQNGLHDILKELV